MIKQQAMGKWLQLKGKAKATWGRATNDRGLEAAGAAQELAGVIQEKSADARLAVEAATDQVKAASKLVHEDDKPKPPS